MLLVQVALVAATNRRAALDGSLRRAGRLDLEVALGPLTLEDRVQVWGGGGPPLVESLLLLLADVLFQSFASGSRICWLRCGFALAVQLCIQAAAGELLR